MALHKFTGGPRDGDIVQIGRGARPVPRVVHGSTVEYGPTGERVSTDQGMAWEMVVTSFGWRVFKREMTPRR